MRCLVPGARADGAQRARGATRVRRDRALRAPRTTSRHSEPGTTGESFRRSNRCATRTAPPLMPYYKAWCTDLSCRARRVRSVSRRERRREVDDVTDRIYKWLDNLDGDY